MSERPFLVIRAQVDPAVLAEFQRWYYEEQRSEMLDIPGVVAAYQVKSPRPEAGWMAILKFHSESALQEALNSNEASRARQSWQRWMPYISEMSVELYTSLGALASYHHWN